MELLDGPHVVENFFAPQPADQAAYNTKLAELADVIRTAEPDLLAVQEIGDEQSFEALRNDLGAGGTGVLSTHFETPHPIRVGWLPPAVSQRWRRSWICRRRWLR